MKVGIVYQPLGVMPLPVAGAGSVAILTYETARRLGKSCEVFVYSRGGTHSNGPRRDGGVLYQWMPVSWDERLSRQFNDHPRIVGRLLGVKKPTRPFFSLGMNNVEYGLRVARDLRARRCDVVHIHNYSQIVSPVRALNPRAKIILHMHCEWLTQLDRTMIERRLAKVDAVIGCSDYITGKIRDAFPQFAGRCHTIHNGVDADVFSPNGRAVSPHGTGKQILFLGRIVPEKGAHVLLQAFQKVFEKHPDTELVMVGPIGLTPRDFVLSLSHDAQTASLSRFYDGNYESALKSPELSGRTGRVSFVGNIPYPSQTDYYRKADVFVCPSVWNDPFPLIVLEAMAAGACVVATRSGGIPELVEHEKTGLLVERGDPRSLADAMIRLLEDEDLRRSLGHAGRQRIVERFTWDAIAGDLYDLYQRLVADEKRTPA